MPVSRRVQLDVPSPARAHVLVATGDARLRARVCEALREDGHRVSSVEDGVALFERLEVPRASARPDLVVAEVDLDGFSGLEILGLTDAGSGRPAIVLLAACIDVPLRIAARRLGAASLLATSLDAETLRSVVRTALCAQPGGAPRVA